MSEVYKMIREDIKTFMKTRQSQELTILRTLDAAIQKKSKDERKEITNDLVIQVLTKEIKQRTDSFEIFKEANRVDLTEKLSVEIGLLKKYLPTQLTDEEVDVIVSNIITETNASSLKDLRLVMPIVMSKTKGRADGKKVNALVKKKLKEKKCPRCNVGEFKDVNETVCNTCGFDKINDL